MTREEKVETLKKKALTDTADIKKKFREDMRDILNRNPGEIAADMLSCYYETVFHDNCLTLLEQYLSSDECFLTKYHSGDTYIFPEKYLDLLLAEEEDAGNFALRYLDCVDRVGYEPIYAVPEPSDAELLRSDFVTAMDVVLYDQQMETHEERE